MPDYPPQFRFECTQCGECCRRKGEVRFDDERFLAMAEALGIEPEAFRIAFDVHFTPDRKEPWMFVVTEEAACPMLEGDLCRVHDARPRQCRTYPFWPETTSAWAWEQEKQHCPGIGLGPEWPIDKAKQIIDEEREGSD